MKSGSMHKYSIEGLEIIANNIRQAIISMLLEAGSGHSAGPLGEADIYTALYFDILKHNPKDPEWNERDILLQKPNVLFWLGSFEV